MIIGFRIHAFIALITAALIVSFLGPLPASSDVTFIGRVAVALGSTAGKIGIVIALATIIGRCLIDSGAADRVVRMFMNLLGEKLAPVSLMTSGFFLSVPVFFDTVFYLLMPLARSMHRRTGQKYLLMILTMGAGATITHALVPPTPGPLIIAENLGIDLGMMMMIGLAISIPTAMITLFGIWLLSLKMDIPMRPIEGAGPEPEPLPDDKLPGLFVSLLPIILPVIMISSNTIVGALADKGIGGANIAALTKVTVILGDANLAMLASAVIALMVLYKQRRPTLSQLSKTVESALMSGGVIILITSAGGAFGAMLKTAQIGPAIEGMFTNSGGEHLAGIKLLLLCFFVAFLLKFAQGSTTVSMITTSAMIASMITSPEAIGFHPVYLACAIGFGAQCGNWMNDSGFWIFAKMSGLTEVETLKTWTLTVSSLAVVGLIITIIFATIWPMA
ncbi:MAG: gluconate permease [Planctomycetes bacterium]|nr:gluconate permease [Planctomycetota bacterium]